VLRCSANANATFSLFGICLSDIIDVDMQKHQRRYQYLYISQVYKRHLLKYCTSLFYMLCNMCRNQYAAHILCA